MTSHRKHRVEFVACAILYLLQPGLRFHHKAARKQPPFTGPKRPAPLSRGIDQVEPEEIELHLLPRCSHKKLRFICCHDTATARERLVRHMVSMTRRNFHHQEWIAAGQPILENCWSLASPCPNHLIRLLWDPCRHIHFLLLVSCWYLPYLEARVKLWHNKLRKRTWLRRFCFFGNGSS